MLPLDFIHKYADIIGLCVLVLIFAAFLYERYAPSVIALVGAAVFLMLGYVDAEDALAAFSNNAPVTIGAMFILSSALVRTGAIEAIAARVMAMAQTAPRRALVLLLFLTVIASAFMNNTPVVLVLIPVVTELAGKMSSTPRHVLIPLSYAAILGGTCTLIGTSTNLLVDGVARSHGQEGFGLFDITLIGVITAVSGAVYLYLVGRFLLPSGPAAMADSDAEDHHTFLTEARIKPESSAVGKTLEDSKITAPRGARFIGVRRGNSVITRPDEEFLLSAGDVVIIRATLAETMTLAERKGLELGLVSRAMPAKGLEIFEVNVAGSADAIGRRLPDISLLSRFPARIIGIGRFGNQPGPDLRSARLRIGDTLLIQAEATVREQLRSVYGMIVAGPPKARAYRRTKAWLAILALLMVVLLASFNTLPIASLALIAVAFILLTRCIDPPEAWSSLDGNVLVLIVAMLILGTALENMGSIELLTTTALPWIENAPPFVLLLGIYVLTSVLTELVTNNAVAVIMTPLVIDIGAELGIDARPLLIAVMFAASASFATPVGYQTNTLVYAAGGYKFADFLKIGAPLNLWVGLTSCLAIYAFVM